MKLFWPKKITIQRSIQTELNAPLTKTHGVLNAEVAERSKAAHEEPPMATYNGTSAKTAPCALRTRPK
jgi:hypothetical protein